MNTPAAPERYKISKRAAGYRDEPLAGRCCKLCFRFRGQKCTAVEGFIFEDGYCSSFGIPRMLHAAATTQRDHEDRLPADREPSPAR
jgi:hypothetical protein